MAFTLTKAKREKSKARICLSGTSGSGKAQPVDTIIPTPNGNKRLGDIKVGDYVFDRFGNSTKVLAVFPQGKKEVFEVTLSDGRSTLCNDEHLWSYYTSKGNLITKTLREMMGTGLIKNDGGHRYKIPVNKAVEYEEKELDVSPYVFGSFIGNGCLTESALTLSSNDVEQVEKVADLLNSVPIKQHENNCNWKFERADKYMASNKKEVKYLQTKEIFNDFYGKKSNDKYIPDEYKYGSIKQRYELLQGLFDTDGYISNNIPRFQISYSTVSKKLAKDVMEILYSLGYSCSLSEDRREDRNVCYSVNVLISNEEKEKLFTLPRKLDRAMSANKYVKRRDYDKMIITDVKDLGYETEMVCIYVDNKEHLYLTNDYIVTHNTLSALYLAYGITKDWDKIAVIDSEKGRSLMYADRTDLPYPTGEFLHLDLKPPYTVGRYIEAMRLCEERVGKDGIIIVDSGSHAWKGEGGVLDLKENIANQRGLNDFSAWNKAGKIQNSFVDTIMDLECGVIITLRSKADYVQEKDEETGKTRVRKIGLAPVQRDDFEYEFMLVLDIDKDTHNATIVKDNTFLDAQGFYGKITPELGKRLKEWMNDGVEPVIYTCECCGKKIKTFAFEDGTTLSPQEIVEKSKETYGKQLCMDCVFKASEEAESQESETTE